MTWTDCIFYSVVSISVVFAIWAIGHHGFYIKFRDKNDE